MKSDEYLFKHELKCFEFYQHSTKCIQYSIQYHKWHLMNWNYTFNFEFCGWSLNVKSEFGGC